MTKALQNSAPASSSTSPEDDGPKFSADLEYSQDDEQTLFESMFRASYCSLTPLIYLDFDPHNQAFFAEMDRFFASKSESKSPRTELTQGKRPPAQNEANLEPGSAKSSNGRKVKSSFRALLCRK